MRHPGKTVEAQVLELIRNRKNFMQFSKILQPEFFQSSATRAIFTEIGRYFKHHNGSRIRHSLLYSSLSVKISDEEVLNEAKRLVRLMHKHSASIDEEYVRDIALDWSKRNIVKQALYDGLEVLEQGNGMDLEEVRTKFDVAANLGVEESGYYQYEKKLGSRIRQVGLVAPVGTGVPTIDDALEGGLDVGEIGLFIGPTHRGKTRSLVNLGVHALKYGRSVCHIIVCDSTAQRIARRYDSTLCNKLYSAIRDTPDLLKKRLRYIQKRGGRLVIKEYDKFAPTPSDLRHWLKTQYQEGKKFDVLIIDYLDEMKPDRHYKEFRFESRDLTSAVRRLASEFKLPIWTASQGNRKSMEKRTVGLEDVAEDIWKSNIADVVVTLNQNDEEKEEMVMRYRVVKARRENFIPRTVPLEITEAGVLREGDFVGGHS